jgi:hypothetical protein
MTPFFRTPFEQEGWLPSKMYSSFSARTTSVYLWTARLLTLIIAVGSPLCAHANKFGDPNSGVNGAKLEEVNEWLAQLQTPGEIREVELALSWPHQLRAASLTEERLLNEGCTYRTSDFTKISAVARLLIHAHPVPAKDSVDRALERMITFTFVDDSQHRIEFSEVLEPDRDLPAASMGLMLVFDSTFDDELLHWAASFHLKNGCAAFVDKR